MRNLKEPFKSCSRIKINKKTLELGNDNLIFIMNIMKNNFDCV